MQYLGESARALVDEATWLAVGCGAAELRPEHLLLSASEQVLEHSLLSETSPWPGFARPKWSQTSVPAPAAPEQLFDTREELIRLRGRLANTAKQQSAGGTPQFSQDTLELFQRAYLAAVQSGDGLVEEVHLLSCLNLSALSFLGERADVRLREVLDPSLLERLKAGGVDTELLLVEIGNFDLRALQPTAEFWHSQSGHRVVALSSSHGQPEAGPFLMLRGIFLDGGPAGEALCRSGLSEALLMEILATLA